MGAYASWWRHGWHGWYGRNGRNDVITRLHATVPSFIIPHLLGSRVTSMGRMPTIAYLFYIHIWLYFSFKATKPNCYVLYLKIIILSLEHFKDCVYILMMYSNRNRKS